MYLLDNDKKSAMEGVLSKSKGRVYCEKCQKYIGPLEICPYCRFKNRKRKEVKLLKYGSVIMAFICLIILYTVGGILGTAKVKIEELDERSNFAYVQIEGTIIEAPRYYPSDMYGGKSGTLEFTVDDDTGILKVRSYPDVTKDLIKEKKIPSTGDYVVVTGNFMVKGNKRLLLLNSHKEIEIHREVPQHYTPLKRISEDEGTAFENYVHVLVAGEVLEVKNTSYSYYIYIKDDENHRLKCEIPMSLLEIYGVLENGNWTTSPEKGKYYSIMGAVTFEEYYGRGYWILHIASPHDIEEITKYEANIINEGY